MDKEWYELLAWDSYWFSFLISWCFLFNHRPWYYGNKIQYTVSILWLRNTLCNRWLPSQFLCSFPRVEMKVVSQWATHEVCKNIKGHACVYPFVLKRFMLIFYWDPKIILKLIISTFGLHFSIWLKTHSLATRCRKLGQRLKWCLIKFFCKYQRIFLWVSTNYLYLTDNILIIYKLINDQRN